MNTCVRWCGCEMNTCVRWWYVVWDEAMLDGGDEEMKLCWMEEMRSDERMMWMWNEYVCETVRWWYVVWDEAMFDGGDEEMKLCWMEETRSDERRREEEDTGHGPAGWRQKTRTPHGDVGNYVVLCFLILLNISFSMFWCFLADSIFPPKFLFLFMFLIFSYFSIWTYLDQIGAHQIVC